MEFAVQTLKLCKSYGGPTVLKSLDLEVRPGEVFALLGPNGAGKTTLMRILTAQLEPTSGKAYVLGKDVSVESDELRNLIGYVPQEMSVWTDITGYENLLIYSKIYGISGKERESRIANILKATGLDEMKGNLVSTYSGGMVRKLEIACAIMIEPKILFLDEPTIGLDPSARKTVWDKLRVLAKGTGTTIVFSTHYMDEADEYADRVGILSNGRIEKIGTPQELKSSVGNQQIKLETFGPLSKELCKKLAAISGVLEVRNSGSSVVLFVKESSTLAYAIFSILVNEKVKIRNVVFSEPTMNDAFLKFAGKDPVDAAKGIRELKGMRKRITGA